MSITVLFSTAIATGSLLSTATSETLFPLFDPSVANSVGTYTTAIAATGISGFGSSQAVEAASGSFSALNDLNGTLQLNISASDFVSVLSGNTSIAQVTNKSNIVADQGTIPTLLQPNHQGKYHNYDGPFLLSMAQIELPI